MKIGGIAVSYFLYRSKSNKTGKAPIYCKLHYNGVYKLFSTGCFVQPEEWTTSAQEVKNEATVENKIFNAVKTKLLGLLIEAYKKDQADVNLNSLVLELRGIKTNSKQMGWIELTALYLSHLKKQIGISYTKSTVDKFDALKCNVEAYIKEYYNKSDLPLKSIKLKHLIEYEEYYKVEKGYKQSTVNKAIQQLKQIMKYALGHEYISKDPWLLYRIKNESIIIEYLSQSELEKIRDSKLNSTKLENVRDCFIFCCYTGLGYSELAMLDKQHISSKNEITWINIIRKKTKKQIKVPMLPHAFKIWTKYHGNLPVISNQKYNIYLKELAEVLKFQKNLKSHLARKTFTSTVLIANDVPIKIASLLLGHTTSQITEKYYAHLTDELVESYVKTLMIKLV